MTVKLTKEQANGIESFICKDIAVKHYVKGCCMSHNLSSLTLDDFIKALYIGYEVEPEFKVGDWLYVDKLGTVLMNQDIVCEIIKIGSDPGMLKLDNRYFIASDSKHIRHATESEIQQEKERRFWARHGRSVWDLKKGDILLNLENQARIIKEVDGHIIRFTNGNYAPLVYVKMDFRIICFAENRLDVNHDDE